MRLTQSLPEVLTHRLANVAGRGVQMGFRFAETMAGSATINGQRRDMRFDAEVRTLDLRDHLSTGKTLLTGKVSVAGLAKDAPLSGELYLRPRSLRYRFTFHDQGGRLLTFTGEKVLHLLNLPEALLHLPGEILDSEGRQVAAVSLRFPLSTLRSFLGSFRLLW